MLNHIDGILVEDDKRLAFNFIGRKFQSKNIGNIKNPDFFKEHFHDLFQVFIRERTNHRGAGVKRVAALSFVLYHLFSVYRSSLADPLFFVRLFGHVLGHAGWDHFIGNMLLFLVIAPPLEERYGSRTLLSGILMTALVSGILQCVLFPSSALLGASGIVFMLIMLSSLAGSRNGGIPITLLLVGALYLSQQVYDILFVQDNVANFMHIVGGACGTVFGFAVRRK